MKTVLIFIFPQKVRITDTVREISINLEPVLYSNLNFVKQYIKSVKFLKLNKGVVMSLVDKTIGIIIYNPNSM